MAAIIALNLADEPIGGDYSAACALRVRASIRLRLASVATDPARRVPVPGDGRLRRLEREPVADLNPGVHTMMTFQMFRDAPFFPDFEAIFAAAPPTFVLLC